jgi:peptide/nickel transport system substrate-binding protein
MFMEQPTSPNWTIDPKIFDNTIGYLPPDYAAAFLASWEFTDTTTYVLHLKQGIKYQNITPANGLELTSADIVYHYHRLFGGGDGFTAVAPAYTTVVQFNDLISVTAPDKYTVVFKWKTPNFIAITGALQAPSIQNSIESPEAVKQYNNDLNDWHKSIGTGPFLITDFVADSSATFVRNPNYWGYDERYPQNKLPYVDSVKVLIITDPTTTLSAMRTGKIDVVDQVSITDSNSIKGTNPEIMQIGIPLGTIYTVDPRNDKAPYNDIRVRIALQKAIDIPTIAATYYGGSASSLPGTLTTFSMTGWTYNYADWPQTLKDEYKYDPAAAKKLLADAGFPNGFNTNIVVSNDFDLNLVQVVKSQFAAIGVNMDIRPLDPAAWSNFVITNHSNDALAARNQGMIGLNYEPNVQINRFLAGYRVNYTMVNDPNYNALIPRAAAATTLQAYQAVMVDANKLVAQQHYVISVCQPNLYTIYQPWLKGFAGQNQSLQGTNGWMLWFFQYGARFWIDSGVKKSLGH